MSQPRAMEIEEAQHDKQPFVGSSVRLNRGGLASCAIPQSEKDYSSYYAFLFQHGEGKQIQKTHVTSGDCFEAETRKFILLELRQFAGVSIVIEALGYEWRDDGELQLDEEPTLMPARAIIRLIKDREPTLSDCMKTWCDGSLREELMLYFARRDSGQSAAKLVKSLYAFQCQVAQVLARRFSLEPHVFTDALSQIKKKRATKDHELREKQKKQKTEKDVSPVIVVQPLQQQQFVFEDRRFDTLGELTGHCSRETSRLRHELELLRVEKSGELQLHQMEKARWQESLRMQLETAYMKGLFKGRLPDEGLDTPTFQSMFGPLTM
jgi:hypothetical protein